MAEKKLILSPTRTSVFLECPLKYKFLYVTRIGKFYYRPKPGNAFGNTIHRVLQAAHQPGMEQVRNDLAMSVYQYIVRQINADRRVFGSIYCLAGGVKVSAELSEQELGEVDEGTRRVASAIMNSEEFRPHRWQGCEDCDFHRICVKQPWFGSED